jgi:hypothetical protein
MVYCESLGDAEEIALDVAEEALEQTPPANRAQFVALLSHVAERMDNCEVASRHVPALRACIADALNPTVAEGLIAAGTADVATRLELAGSAWARLLWPAARGAATMRPGVTQAPE